MKSYDRKNSKNFVGENKLNSREYVVCTSTYMPFKIVKGISDRISSFRARAAFWKYWWEMDLKRSYIGKVLCLFMVHMEQMYNQGTCKDSLTEHCDCCTQLCLSYQWKGQRGKEGQGVARAHMSSGCDSWTVADKGKDGPITSGSFPCFVLHTSLYKQCFTKEKILQIFNRCLKILFLWIICVMYVSVCGFGHVDTCATEARRECWITWS